MKHLPVLLLLVLTATVYANSFPGEFHYDDFELLLENPRVVTEGFDYAQFLYHYGGRPLTLWTFHANHRLFGPRPVSYHAFSFFLHLTVTVALYLLIRRLARRQESGISSAAATLTAFLSALLFALHPLQTQAVNYIWSRSMLLMSLFALSALLVLPKRPGWSLFLTQLAIWSRVEGLIVVPFLIWADRRRWKSFGLLAVVNLILFLAGLFALAPTEVGWNHSNWLVFYQSQPLAFLKYLALMLWPSDLHIDRDFPDAGLFSFTLSLLVLGLLASAAWRIRRSHPLPALGALWTAAWLAPSMLVPNTDLVNESRAYLALAGFALIGGRFLTGLVGRREPIRRWGVGLAVVFLTFLMVSSTRERNRLWGDDLALYQDAVKKSPGKGRVHYNLASALARAGRVAEAEEEFRASLRLEPEDDLTFAALGYCAEVLGRPQEALMYYRRALDLNPENGRAGEGLSRLTAMREEEL